MKTTEYFRYRRKAPDRAWIRDEWIQHVIDNPLRSKKQADGRIRIWAPIAEANNMYLRVILLPDRQTVHNAFFDRDFQP